MNRIVDPSKYRTAEAADPIGSAPHRGSSARPALHRCLSDYFPTLAVIGVGLLFYTHLSTYFLGQYKIRWTPSFGGHLSLETIDMAMALQGFAILYMVVLIPYYLMRPHARSSASVAFEYGWRFLRHGNEAVPSEAERQAMLCLLLKFIFIPFCIHGMLVYMVYLDRQVAEFHVLRASLPELDAWSFYNRHLHYFLLNVIFLIDFVPFVIGYLVQSRTLKNEIVSVDATLAGWTVCLLCYPPFNAAMVQLIPFQVSDLAPAYPMLPASIHILLNVALLVCFALYASASVSLGFKCSNLTNRGVVDGGLYGVMRHPAYLFKNAAWWLGALPGFIALSEQSVLTAFWGMLCLAGWSALYVMRAIREEKHMLLDGNGYAAYMTRVPYRFIPGIC